MKNPNVIEIELDTEADISSAKEQDVYIGGPTALFGAYMEAKTKQQRLKGTTAETNDLTDTPQISYYHNGSRGLSNWKGSASYFHVRGCVPAYYWKDNAGTYALYITLKHALEKKLSLETYYDQVYNDLDFNMLRINFKGLLKELNTLPLYLKNTWHMLHDVGFHPTSYFVFFHHSKAKEQKMRWPMPLYDMLP